MICQMLNIFSHLFIKQSYHYHPTDEVKVWRELSDLSKILVLREVEWEFKPISSGLQSPSFLFFLTVTLSSCENISLYQAQSFILALTTCH